MRASWQKASPSSTRRSTSPTRPSSRLTRPMASVHDDPSNPDAGFAELYAQLPDATELWPWLELAQGATPPVLYLGIGSGRLAAPLSAAGIEGIVVASPPRMVGRP